MQIQILPNKLSFKKMMMMTNEIFMYVGEPLLAANTLYFNNHCRLYYINLPTIIHGR